MYEDKTLESLKQEILNKIDLPLAKNEGSFLNELASGFALGNANIYVVLDEIYNRAFLQNAYDDILDARLQEFGYKRKAGTKTVAYITVYGIEGTTVPHETVFSYQDKNYVILESAEPYVITSGAVNILVMAEKEGKDYNLTSSIELSCDLNNVDKVTNMVIKTIGTDPETDDEFRDRFYFMQAHKGTSGNIDDYVNWALEVQGVKTAKCIPLWNGNGTVKVVVMGENGRNVSEDIVTAVKEHIEMLRPIGASVTVATPSVLSINVSATVEVQTGFTIDGIKEAFKIVLGDYLNSDVKEITYTKVGAILSSIEGVVDYSNLLVNTTNKNVKIADDQIGAVGTVLFNVGVIE
ncbi:baseplate J/gp47 family protein [Peptostreptococcus equinus]|uniref:Baseplate J/gp47 family protein n=1 Tax=Peptostreptococcus equinus TaxID=3003601 RepID=A0ABY7JPK5_9FIRM|nr:baseplate J/gp47 family protein [Peptostreptococcus sp. CBA3647]WAW14612.1 baseplate J/gp47 family protein [Peptostreptococcus sp. CBA3647]WAW15297.1 baseplate J/gp47 family protein [Peptostreptococcus sp. CBA3647]